MGYLLVQNDNLVLKKYMELCATRAMCYEGFDCTCSLLFKGSLRE